MKTHKVEIQFGSRGTYIAHVTAVDAEAASKKALRMASAEGFHGTYKKLTCSEVKETCTSI